MKLIKRKFTGKSGYSYTQLFRCKKYCIYSECSNNSPICYVLFQIRNVNGKEYIPPASTAYKEYWVFDTLSDTFAKLEKILNRKLLKKNIRMEIDSPRGKDYKKMSIVEKYLRQLEYNEMVKEKYNLAVLEKELKEIKKEKAKKWKVEHGKIFKK